MPLDAICLGAVTNELNETLAGCRVEKVYQPDRDEIVLQTRGQGGARRLLLSIAAGAPRAHFIDTARENPAAPPMFWCAAQACAGREDRRYYPACGRTYVLDRAGHDGRNGCGLQKASDL